MIFWSDWDEFCGHSLLSFCYQFAIRLCRQTLLAEHAYWHTWPDLSLIVERISCQFGDNLLTRYRKIAERLPEKSTTFLNIAKRFVK